MHKRLCRICLHSGKEVELKDSKDGNGNPILVCEAGCGKSFDQDDFVPKRVLRIVASATKAHLDPDFVVDSERDRSIPDVA